MLQYTDWTNLILQSTQNKWKANDRVSQLNFLNDLVSGTHGKLLTYLYGQLHKIIPSKVGDQDDIMNFLYGHLFAIKTASSIRISSCLDINNSIQFPIEELQFFNKGNLLFLTCGDVYLIISTKKLKYQIENELIQYTRTKLKNYEIFISDLFDAQVIESFGFINLSNGNITHYSDLGINNFNVNNITLAPTYLKYKLRGCIIASNPNYILCVANSSDCMANFKFSLHMTRGDLSQIGKKYNWPKSAPGMGNYIKKHTDNFFSEKKSINQKDILQMGTLKIIVLKWNKIKDIEKIRQYCQLYVQQKQQLKSYSIHWAVKKSKFCRSKEEYLHYKKYFQECNDIKDKYSIEEILTFKDSFSCPKFKYNKNVKYHYYK